MIEFLKQRKDLLVPAVLLVLSFGILSYNSFSEEKSQPGILSRAVLAVFSYPQRALMYTARGVVSGLNRYIYLIGVEGENLESRERIEELLAENNLLLEENIRLKQRVGFREISFGKTLEAEVIGISPVEEFRTITINRGALDGVRWGMPVIRAEGVIGRIIGSGGSRKVPPNVSQVLLLTDPRCAADALSQRTRSRGVIRGRGDYLTLDFMERGEDVRVGDRIITSGLGGAFPKGLFLGRVVEVKEGYGLTQNIQVEAAVDFSKLEDVWVILKEEEAKP